jgi:hypothetical protein
MVNRILKAMALLLLLLATGGCAKAAMVGAPGGAMAMEPPPPPATLAERGRDRSAADFDTEGELAQAAPRAPLEATAPPSDPSTPPPPPPSQVDAELAGPLLIYTAQVGLAVFETEKSLDKVEKMAREAGGYLVVRRDNAITIRVPASRFDSVLAETMKLGDVLERNVEVRDVTEEYYDVQTRLRNMEAVLERLQVLLEKADSVEDALKVEAELARVATDVERMKGRLKLLRELISFSTITVECAAQAQEHVDSNVNLPFPWLEGLGLSNLLSL